MRAITGSTSGSPPQCASWISRTASTVPSEPLISRWYAKQDGSVPGALVFMYVATRASGATEWGTVADGGGAEVTRARSGSVFRAGDAIHRLPM